MVYYTEINGGHSVGVELEYCLFNDQGQASSEALCSVISSVYKQLGLKNGHNSAKVYRDMSLVELCSSPQATISNLFAQMSEMYEALKYVATKQSLSIFHEAFFQDPNCICQYPISQPSVVAASHVHTGHHYSEQESQFFKLVPFLPIFIGLANNSPDKEFPLGSKRLRKSHYGKIIHFGSSYTSAGTRAIRQHNMAPTIEVRCMDRAQAVKEDIAVAAFVFATAEFLKEQNFVNDIFGLTKSVFEWLYDKDGVYDYCRDNPYHLTEIMIGEVSKHGLDALVPDQPHKLRQVAQNYYLQIRPKLREIDTPNCLISILERKLGEAL